MRYEVDHQRGIVKLPVTLCQYCEGPTDMLIGVMNKRQTLFRKCDACGTQYALASEPKGPR